MQQHCIPKSLLLILLFIAAILNRADADDVKQELRKHFSYDDKQLKEVSGLLLQMKELAHSQTYGDRLFSHDSASDSKKDVSISIEQPKTNNKLTPYLFEGDILLSAKQAEAILETISRRPSKRRRTRIKPKDFDRQRRSFSADPEAKWTEFPIRYRFHESLALYQITQIINAIEYWQSHTCLKFHNDDKATGDFIEFFKGEGCYSMIGRFGGRQGVSIGDGCERVGTIEHEIGHALGLWHEQSRPDAGQHIEVLKAFILPSYISDFLERGKDEIDTLGIPYDLGSVMHYGSTAFSADQRSKTLLTRDPFYQTTIGQRETLSFYDMKIVNEAYCKGKCKGKNECKNGGYMNPSSCKSCLCPSGFGGSKCEKNEKSLESPCGGVFKATNDWQNIESPGYPDPGYESGEKCSWLIETTKEKRIEVEFVDDFDIFCASTCVDYVELKIGADLRNTGFRFCCPDHPKGALVSALSQVVVIFRSAIGEGAGFRLRFRSTMKPARTTMAPPKKTTTVPPTTVAGENIWSDWGSWSECSRPCGGCGIRSRVRMCATAECSGKSQEFSTCNLKACPVDPKCANMKFINRLCTDSYGCAHLSDALSSCNQPSCCPPFYEVNGQCQSDEPVLSVFLH